MQKGWMLFLSLSVLFLVIPGCRRLVNWAQPEFYQSEEAEVSLASARKYIRSISAYDEFNTIGKFDVLWLSDTVRTSYSQLNGYMFGKSEEQQKSFLRRQLEENNHFITFLVLIPYDMSLGEVDSLWTLFLEVDNDNFVPIEIKYIELTPQYREIFGKKFSRFRTAYQIKFDAKDVGGKNIIDDQTRKIFLHFRSPSKKFFLAWDLDDIGSNVTSATEKE